MANMIPVEEEVECPECGHRFYTDLEAEVEEDERLDVEDAAERLLKYYTGHEPGAGDVETLKTKIKDALVSLGVSEGTI